MELATAVLSNSDARTIFHLSRSTIDNTGNKHSKTSTPYKEMEQREIHHKPKLPISTTTTTPTTTTPTTTTTKLVSCQNATLIENTQS